MMKKLELFLRGETFLHLATMFLCMVSLMQVSLFIGIKLPLWFLFPLSLFVGIAWELVWKIRGGREISITDILGTFTGGVLAILILRL